MRVIFGEGELGDICSNLAGPFYIPQNLSVNIFYFSKIGINCGGNVIAVPDQIGTVDLIIQEGLALGIENPIAICMGGDMAFHQNIGSHESTAQNGIDMGCTVIQFREVVRLIVVIKHRTVKVGLERVRRGSSGGQVQNSRRLRKT